MGVDPIDATGQAVQLSAQELTTGRLILDPGAMLLACIFLGSK
jgi:hypothetical protein